MDRIEFDIVIQHSLYGIGTHTYLDMVLYKHHYFDMVEIDIRLYRFHSWYRHIQHNNLRKYKYIVSGWMKEWDCTYLQLYPSRRSTHVPFLHGFDAHSFISDSQ
jgi:hypothetical protein